MTLQQAMEMIRGSTKSESRDHVFGDREVYWEKDGKEIASGYFSSTTREVVMTGSSCFEGEAAYQLDRVPTVRLHGSICRNDETGEDTYRGA